MVDFAKLLARQKRMGGVKIWNKRDRNTPKGVMYGGRPGVLGNPFEVGKHGQQGECCDMFDAWLITGNWRHIKNIEVPAATEEKRQAILKMLPSLKGQDMECWCWPKRCHLETVAWLANVANLKELGLV